MQAPTSKSYSKLLWFYPKYIFFFEISTPLNYFCELTTLSLYHIELKIKYRKEKG